MEHYTNSLYCFQQLKVEIEKINEALNNFDFKSLEVIVLSEEEVLQYLKISRSTLYKYKKEKKIKGYPLYGRTVYLKHQISENVINQFIK